MIEFSYKQLKGMLFSSCEAMRVWLRLRLRPWMARLRRFAVQCCMASWSAGRRGVVVTMVALMAGAAGAQELSILMLQNVDGSYVPLRLASYNRIAFDGANVVVSSRDDEGTAPISLPYGSFAGVKFGDSTTGVGGVFATATPGMRYDAANGCLSLVDVTGASQIFIYNTVGQLVATAVIDENNNSSVSGLRPGMYIVTTDGNVAPLKIAVK